MYKCQDFNRISRIWDEDRQQRVLGRTTGENLSLGAAGQSKNCFCQGQQSVPRDDVVNNIPFYSWGSGNFSSAPSVFWEHWQWCLLNNRWQTDSRDCLENLNLSGETVQILQPGSQNQNQSLFSVNCWSCLFVQSKLNCVCFSWGGGPTTRATWDRLLYVWKSKCCFLSAQLQFALLSLPWAVERLCLFLSSLCSVSHTSLLNIWY